MFDAAATGGVNRGSPPPPFASDRLRELNRERLVYEPPKPGAGGRGLRLLEPLELLDRLDALVPPPRVHRHRYFGVLARTAPLTGNFKNNR